MGSDADRMHEMKLQLNILITDCHNAGAVSAAHAGF